jgi:hypothetical protein
MHATGGYAERRTIRSRMRRSRDGRRARGVSPYNSDRSRSRSSASSSCACSPATSCAWAARSWSGLSALRAASAEIGLGPLLAIACEVTSDRPGPLPRGARQRPALRALSRQKLLTASLGAVVANSPWPSRRVRRHIGSELAPTGIRRPGSCHRAEATPPKARHTSFWQETWGRARCQSASVRLPGHDLVGSIRRVEDLVRASPDAADATERVSANGQAPDQAREHDGSKGVERQPDVGLGEEP